ncbi:MAG: hypothetical protein AB1422_16360 [bacterium]
MSSKKVVLSGLGIVGILLFGYAIYYAIFPVTTESDLVSYHAPCWGEKNKIYFIKKVSFARKILNPMSLLSIGFFGGGDYLPDHTEVYLCSMNYDGTDKKEIVKIGDTDDNTYWLPMYLDYCKANNLLLLSGGMHPARGEVYQGIYTIKSDGRDKRKISEVGLHATWSPDGRQIVHSGGFIMNADGSNNHPIFSKNSECWGKSRDFIWSPRGDLIAFVCHGWIYTMKPDGSERRKVCKGDRLKGWTLDGKEIIGDGYTVRLDSKEEKLLYDAEAGTYWGGRYSLDGRFMLGEIGFVVRDIETMKTINLFADIEIKGKHREHFVYKRPNNIW